MTKICFHNGSLQPLTVIGFPHKVFFLNASLIFATYFVDVQLLLHNLQCTVSLFVEIIVFVEIVDDCV